MPSITVRISDEVAEEIDELATAMDRTRTWIVAKALERYLRDEREWIAMVRAGQEDFEHGRFVAQETVMADVTARLDRAVVRKP